MTAKVPGKKRGAKPKYPWEKWLGQKRLRLVRGKHYTCEPNCMMAQIRMRAWQAGRKVTVSIQGDIVKAIWRD
jgi:hypothetical protein